MRNHLKKEREKKRNCCHVAMQILMPYPPTQIIPVKKVHMREGMSDSNMIRQAHLPN